MSRDLAQFPKVYKMVSHQVEKETGGYQDVPTWEVRVDGLRIARFDTEDEANDFVLEYLDENIPDWRQLRAESVHVGPKDY